MATLGRLDQLTGELDAVIAGLLKVSGRQPVGAKTAAAPAVISASSLSFEAARALGNVWALTELWKELGFSDLRRVFRPTRHTIDVEALIRIMVLNRRYHEFADLLEPLQQQCAKASAGITGEVASRS